MKQFIFIYLRDMEICECVYKHKTVVTKGNNNKHKHIYTHTQSHSHEYTQQTRCHSWTHFRNKQNFVTKIENIEKRIFWGVDNKLRTRV